VLRTHRLTKRFGAQTAVDSVDITVRAGTLHAIIGPNGAGKTTLFNMLGGQTRPTAGTIVFAERDITRLGVADRSRIAIGRSFQQTNVFPKLSVFENVRLAAQSRTRRSFAVWEPVAALTAVNARAEDVLAEAGLLVHRAKAARELAGGDQRLLELAITLATDPVLLLLDEPSQGLSPADAHRLVDRIRTLAARYTIVLIEHNMPLVMSLADEISVMHLGRVLAHGTPAEIRANSDVRAAYLGKHG
jgi:ABC-type branched-subunit amino acid transport system ATPase component